MRQRAVMGLGKGGCAGRRAGGRAGGRAHLLGALGLLIIGVGVCSLGLFLRRRGLLGRALTPATSTLLAVGDDVGLVKDHEQFRALGGGGASVHAHAVAKLRTLRSTRVQGGATLEARRRAEAAARQWVPQWARALGKWALIW